MPGTEYWIGMSASDPRYAKRLALEHPVIAKLAQEGKLFFGGGTTQFILRFIGNVPVELVSVIEVVLRTKLRGVIMTQHILSVTQQCDQRTPLPDVLSDVFIKAAQKHNVYRVTPHISGFLEPPIPLLIQRVDLQFRDGFRYRTLMIVGNPGTVDAMIDRFIVLLNQVVSS